MDEISRRDLVTGTAALAAAAAVPAAPALAQAAPATPALAQVQVVVPPVTLECAFMTKVYDGVTCRVRAYNGQIPGPTIKVYPGNKLNITVKNSLPPYNSIGWPGDHNVPHNLGSTNLHVHGMDVIPHLFKPIGTSDPTASMIEIKPGDSLEYPFEVPIDHPPGFDWYHPHHHGSTAVQAVTGMAGGIIVMGAIDEVPEIKAARDIPLVINDIGLFQTDPKIPPSPANPDGLPGTTPEELGLPPGTDISNYWTYLPKQNAIWQTFAGDVTMYVPSNPAGKQYPVQPALKGGFTTGDYALRYYLLNGEPFFKETHNANAGEQAEPTAVQLNWPRIPMAPGEVVRFRMLNACSDNYMPIAVEGHTMHLLALDGVNFPHVRAIAPVPIPTEPPPRPTDGKRLPYEGQIQLAPANRAEFLIKAGDVGHYKIVQLAQNQQFLFSAQKTIAEIVVSGPPKIMALPTELPVPTRLYPLIKPSEVQVMRTIYFADQFPGTQNPYVGIDFLLNGQQYDVKDINYVVNLNGVEEWHLIVGDSQHGGSEGHPFHIHVNSFEVISVNGKMLEPGTIKDTVWIPAESKVVIRTRFKEFWGKSVFHCHILPHEDTGMMQNFLIKKPGEPIPTALAEAPRLPPSRLNAPGMAMPDHGANHK